MEIDGKTLRWTRASFSGFAPYSPSCLGRPTFVALNSCRSLDFDALGTVDQVFKCLWAWVAESNVPELGEGTAWFPLGIAIETIPSNEEGAPRDVFGNVFKDELVVTVFDESKD
jgi:hypothetical protein